MRPRLLHLGSLIIGRAKVRLTRGFNEAEAFTPRIPRGRAKINCRKGCRFNEAEAFTPRIPFCGRLLFTGFSSRFNEAEAFTPRIHCEMAIKEGYIAGLQ